MGGLTSAGLVWDLSLAALTRQVGGGLNSDEHCSLVLPSKRPAWASSLGRPRSSEACSFPRLCSGVRPRAPQGADPGACPVLGALSKGNLKIMNIEAGIGLGKRPPQVRCPKLELQALPRGPSSSGRLCSWALSEPLLMPWPRPLPETGGDRGPQGAAAQQRPSFPALFSVLGLEKTLLPDARSPECIETYILRSESFMT